MSKFRGQYMDMVHPSSDVHVVDKPNHAGEQPVKMSLPTVSVSSEPEKETLFDAPEIDTYESPFLPDVEVEKRPLGGSIDNDAHDVFDINEFIDLSQIELPADDGGEGELEPALSPGEENGEKIVIAESELDSESSEKVDSAPRNNVAKSHQPATRNAVINTMIPPQYKEPETKQIPQSRSPFSHAGEAIEHAPTRKPMPVWVWMLLFVLIAIAGAAAGAAIYLVMG